MVQSFHYPPAGSGLQGGPSEFAAEEQLRGARNQSQEQAQAAAVLAALEQGLREGEARAKAAMEALLEQTRGSLLRAINLFSVEKTQYFRGVEAETVRLALAIARKILHREAQLDPLLLAGIVRVALDRMQAGSHVTLRASQDSVETWRTYFREKKHETGDHEVQVVADDALASHVCVLQAEAGNMEISLERQLQEIESGFFDLLAGPTSVRL